MREFGNFAFIAKDLSGAFREFSSVTMPASFPLQLLKISPKSLFVLKAFKFKHSLMDYFFFLGANSHPVLEIEIAAP